MTLTAKQRERRKTALGASDIPAIIGKDPFRSAYDLWLDKSGRLPEPDAAEEHDRFAVNNALEPAILQLSAMKLGRPVVKPTATFTHGAGILLANVDGMVEKFAKGQPIVEAKSTSIAEGWGEPDSDQVPSRVLIQVQMQMLCSSSKVAYVARLLGQFGFKFEMYRVEFNEKLAAELLRRAHAFWTDHVEADVAPEVTPFNIPDIDLLSQIDREDKAVEIPAEIIEQFIALNRARIDAEKAEEEAKARLIAALGDGNRGECPGFNVKYTLVKTSKFNAKKFEVAHPDLFNSFKRESGYRKLSASVAKPEKKGKA